MPPRLRAIIESAGGELRLDDYMAHCLYDPIEGYYATQTVFGAKGDFVTAPEISQIYGELVAVWIMDAWRSLGSPAAFNLVEMGAGRGLMMQDVLRVAQGFPKFDAAIGLFILENSPRRRVEQARILERNIEFLDDLHDLPAKPTIFLANEFFDALPIRQFRDEGGGWLERYMDRNLQMFWKPNPNPPKSLAGHNTPQIIELNEPMMAIGRQISDHFSHHGGALFAADYGEWCGYGDTLQAVRGHQYVSIDCDPGQADLTAHVRFMDLMHAINRGQAHFATQSEFLDAMGGQARLQHLVDANPDARLALSRDYQRLTSPDEMGELFKVLTIKAPPDE